MKVLISLVVSIFIFITSLIWACSVIALFVYNIWAGILSFALIAISVMFVLINKKRLFDEV